MQGNFGKVTQLYSQLLIPAVIGKTDQRKHDGNFNQHAYYRDQGCTRLQAKSAMATATASSKNPMDFVVDLVVIYS